VTMTKLTPVSPADDALIVAPLATPVTTPLTLMVGTRVLPLDQVTAVVRSTVLPSVRTPVTCRVTVSPVRCQKNGEYCC
jgi:hypothetical protein